MNCTNCGSTLVDRHGLCQSCGKQHYSGVNVVKGKNTSPWLIIGIAIAVFYVWGKIKPNSDNSTAQTNTETAIADQVIDVTADQLTKDYDQNEPSADGFYRGKTVRVSGVIDRIGIDILDHDYVILKGYNNVEEIQCTFREKGVVNSYRKGEQTTIKGKVGKKIINVQLDHCAAY